MKRVLPFLFLILMFGSNSLLAQSPALNFTSSSSQQVDLGMMPETLPSTLTVEAWIKPTSFGSAGNYTNTIFGADKSTGPSAGFALRCGSTGLLSFVIGNGGWPEAVSPSNALITNQWQHVAGTFDGDTIKIYVNGSLVSSAYTSSGIVNDSAITCFIGASNFTGRTFDGSIENVRLWKVERTQAQIAANACTNYTGSEPGLVESWLLNEGTGTTTAGINSWSGSLMPTTAPPTWTTANTCGSCADPYGFSATNITGTTADLEWISGAPAWEVEWGATGFTPGTGNVESASSNPYTIGTATALTPSTVYDVYVRANCTSGSNGYSNWVGPYTFQTAYAVPYLEDWSSGYPHDWTEAAGLISNATVFTSTSSAWTSGSFSNVGSVSAKINIYGTTRKEWLLSPSIDLGTGSTYELTFDAGLTPYFGTGTATLGADDTVRVVISPDNGLTWSDTNTIVMLTSSTTISNGTGTEFTASLAGYSGLIKLGFYAQTTVSNADNDFFIDNVDIHVPPACPKPTALTDSNITTSSIQLGWQSSGSGPWYIYWGPCGFDQATPTVALDTAYTNNIVLSGLTSNTSYEFYVFEDCGVNGFSDSVATGCITTLCSSINIPFTENFDNPSVTESCWTILNANGDGDAWNLNSTAYPYNGTESAAMYTDFNSGNNDDWMISPALVLTGNERLKFQYRVRSSNEPNDFELLVSTTGANPADFTDTLLPLNSYSNTSYQQMTIDLSSISDTAYIAWHVPPGGLDGWYLYIDEVIVEPIPPCLEPDSLTLVAKTPNSAIVSWSAGGAPLHNVEFGSAGHIPGTGIFVNTSNTSDTLTGLSPNTAYDVYVQTDCGADSSIWIGPLSFTTPCLPVSMPYYESFDTWPLSCWDSTGGTQYWSKYDPGTGDNYALANFWGWPAGNFAVLTTPAISITQDAQVRLKWSHLFSSSYPNDELMVRATVAGSDVWDTLVYLQGAADFNDPSAGNTSPGTFIEKKTILDPALYTGQDVIVQLIAHSGYGPNLYINDFYVDNAPTCPPLINAAVNNVTDSSATLGWGASNAATSYQIWFGPQGFFQGTATTGGVQSIQASNSYNVDTLSGNTCYEYLVRSICSAGDTSEWVGPVQFCTPCKPTSAPYFESYDIWPLSCWGMDGGSQNWAIYSPGGSDNYALANVLGWPAGNKGHMTSPVIELGTDKYSVSYEWSHLYNATYADDQLVVLINKVGTSTWDTISNLIGSANFNDSTAGNTSPGNFIKEKIILDSVTYANSFVQVRFIANSDYGPNLYINNFNLKKASNCADVDSVHYMNVTAITADIGWLSGSGNSTLWYGPAGFYQGPGTTGGTKVTGVTSVHTLTGLNPATTYDVYVQDTCTNGDVSDWIGPVTFTTACAPFSLPYIDEFGTSAGIPNCFSTFNQSGSTSVNAFWRYAGTWPDYGAVGMNNAPGSAGGSIGVDGSTPSDSAVVLETPEFDFTNTSSPYLKFKKFQNNTEPTNPASQTLYVDFYDGANWHTDLIVDSTSSPAWVSHALDLSGYTISGPVKFHFRVNKYTGNPSPYYSDILIDDLAVMDSASCKMPINVSVTPVTCDSIMVNWSSSEDSTYIAMGPSGSIPTTVMLVQNDTVAYLTGTTANTAYDVYTASICNGDTSALSGPVPFNSGNTGSPSVVVSYTPNGYVVSFDASGSSGNSNTYSWDFGDGNTGTGDTVSHTYATGGDKTVSLTVTNNCGSADSTFVVAGVSLEELAIGAKVLLFPNPANDLINVEVNLDQKGPLFIEMLSLRGQLIARKSYDSANTVRENFDVSGLADGIYMIRIKTEKGTINRKLIKK